MGILLSVSRDVQSPNLGLGKNLKEIVHQKPLGGSDIENGSGGLQPVIFNEPPGHREPTAVVSKTAVSVTPFPVKKIPTKLFRDPTVFIGFRRRPRPGIPFYLWKAVKEVDFSHN
jgi:hypothetical protein